MPNRTPPSLSLRTDDGGRVIVTVNGELDTLGTREIEPAFSVALSDRTVHAIVDMSGVPFVTSAGLAMLITHAQALSRGGGGLALAGVQPIVQQTLERAGFMSVFPFYDSVEEAARMIESGQLFTSRTEQDPPPHEVTGEGDSHTAT